VVRDSRGTRLGNDHLNEVVCQLANGLAMDQGHTTAAKSPLETRRQEAFEICILRSHLARVKVDASDLPLSEDGQQECRSGYLPIDQYNTALLL